MYHVYILYSELADKYYIGYTGELLSERLRKHNSKHKGYTGSVNDWTLVHFETFDSKQEALLREKQIKNWKSRLKIKMLINHSASSAPPD